MESVIEEKYIKRIITEIIISLLGLVTKNLRAVSFQLNNSNDIVMYFYLLQINEYEKEIIDDFLFEFEAYHGEIINIEKKIIEVDKDVSYQKYIPSSQIVVLAKNK